RSLEPGDFIDGDLIGILGGPLSNGNRPGHALAIIDLDAAEAVATADALLPPTGVEEGRPPPKIRHPPPFLGPLLSIPSWAWSTAEQAAAAAKKAKGHPGPFKKAFNHAKTKQRVIDLIGTGEQAACPCPAGQRVWVGGEPAVVPFLQLWDAVCELAFACGCKLPFEKNAAGRSAPNGQADTDVVRRAVAYLATIPGAISGQNGHCGTYWPARVVCWGFALGEDLGFQGLCEHFHPPCHPPWPAKDQRATRAAA